MSSDSHGYEATVRGTSAVLSGRGDDRLSLLELRVLVLYSPTKVGVIFDLRPTERIRRRQLGFRRTIGRTKLVRAE